MHIAVGVVSIDKQKRGTGGTQIPVEHEIVEIVHVSYEKAWPVACSLRANTGLKPNPGNGADTGMLKNFSRNSGIRT